ncbi:MAG: reverse transcriptase domain-containing protein [Anaerolineae bacterium]
MGLIAKVADLNHLSQVVSHYQQRYRSRSGKGRLFPGSDGETLAKFTERLDSNLCLLSESLLRGDYSFSPFLERNITTAGGATKTIATATLQDTIVQKATALVVEPELDSHVPNNCYSFRLGKEAPSINDAISAIVRYHRTGLHWVVKEDISSYFDNLNHDLLAARLEELLSGDLPILSFYRNYLKAPRLVKGELLPRERGVPVGSILANSLSNLYLTPLDSAMEERGHRYLRYCDDIIAFCEDEGEALQVRKMVADMATRLGLTLNPSKSLLLPPAGRFVHLGYEFDGQDIRIGPRALHKFKIRIRRATSRNGHKGLTVRDLHTDRGRAALREVISWVNREVGGDTPRNWARYFSKCDFDDQFRDLDYWIRNRVRAAVTKRWNKGNYRLLPTPLLQELGLKSLVAEYYKWKNRWQDKDKRLIQGIANLDHLRDTLDGYRQRYFNSYIGAYDFKPGADGVRMEQFLSAETSNLTQIQDSLLTGAYRFTPFIEYTKPKRGRQDQRVICRASLADTVVQKAVARVVDRRFDHLLSDRCYSYRRGKSQFTAIGQVLTYIRTRENWWVLRYDFRSFLDTVDLTILSSQLEELLGDEPQVLDLYLKYLHNGRQREGKLLPRTHGLPRGGVLTPFLTNLYLAPLDQAMVHERFHCVRYADDVIIFAESESRAREAQRLMKSLTAELRLHLSPEKSLLIQPGGEFEYLGYLIKGREVRVRPYAINSLKRRIKRATARRKYPRLTTKTLASDEGKEALSAILGKVNRAYIYKGGNDWTRHFCRCTSDEQFRELDAWIADRIRASVTKRWALKNRRLVPYKLLRELGWKPLVPLFHRWRREVWEQGGSNT